MPSIDGTREKEMSKRQFTAAKDSVRCKANTRLSDGSLAQCMKAQRVDGLCLQHAKMVKEQLPAGLSDADVAYCKAVEAEILAARTA